jgi:hypothetical protein
MQEIKELYPYIYYEVKSRELTGPALCGPSMPVSSLSRPIFIDKKHQLFCPPPTHKQSDDVTDKQITIEDEPRSMMKLIN